MKYFKQSNMYRNSTGTCTFNPETMEARSYDWWVFVKEIKGLIVFNTYMYSNTTSKHQSNLKRLLSELGIKVDHWIEAPQGLQNLASAIAYYESEIVELQSAIDRRRSRYKTNRRRKDLIKTYQDSIIETKLLMRLESNESQIA